MRTFDGYSPEMAAYGVTERLFALAAQPFIRPGAPNFDNAYACSIWDASVRVDLARRAMARPDDKSVCVYSDKFPIMGVVRHGT